MQRLTTALSEIAAAGRIRSEDTILLGPRGVGKTVALSAFAQIARSSGFEVVNLQAVALGGFSLVPSLLDTLDAALARNAGPWQRAKSAFDRIDRVSVGMPGANVGIDTRTARAAHPRPVDPTMLAAALAELAHQVRQDAPTGGVLLTIDELQVAAHADLALLAATLHRLTVDHRELAVFFAGSGLPHTPTVLRDAHVTHPDRLFRMEPIPGVLLPQDAAYAIVEPARRRNVLWSPEAADQIVKATAGYPAHVQLFAHETWLAAAGPNLITPSDARKGIQQAQVRLLAGTLEPRWNEMTERQMEYIAALAVHGGHSTSRAIADTLDRDLEDLSMVRSALIGAGDVHSPQRGRIVLTVPAFGDFVLSRYEQARAEARVPMTSLARMNTNTAATAAAGASDLAARAAALPRPVLPTTPAVPGPPAPPPPGPRR